MTGRHTKTNNATLLRPSLRRQRSHPNHHLLIIPRYYFLPSFRLVGYQIQRGETQNPPYGQGVATPCSESCDEDLPKLSGTRMLHLLRRRTRLPLRIRALTSPCSQPNYRLPVTGNTYRYPQRAPHLWRTTKIRRKI